MENNFWYKEDHQRGVHRYKKSHPAWVFFFLNVANKRDQQIFLFLYFPLKQCLIGAIKNLLVSSLNVWLPN